MSSAESALLREWCMSDARQYVSSTESALLREWCTRVREWCTRLHEWCMSVVHESSARDYVSGARE